MNKKLIFRIAGIILCIEAACLLFPLLVALAARERCWQSFLLTMALCAACGLPLLALRPEKRRMQPRDGYAAVALGWLLLSLFGALPYSLSGSCGYIDALFETVSGFTTTGASIFSSPASLPRGILFWRALTQWMGGMGVLVLLLALLPKLGDGSVNLMKAESPGPISTKLLPRTNDTAKMLYIIYIALTALEMLALRIARMPWFDAVTTALTTISTGGFSIRDESIAYYQSEAIVWIVCFFMFVAAINFSLLFMLAVGRRREALHSEELRVYVVVVIGAVALIALNLIFKMQTGVYQAISLSAFQVLSLISTSGFATTDFALWPAFSQSILLLVMFTGGCAGSTAGGLKISRVVLLFKELRRELRRILHTREVRPITLDGQRVEENTLASVSLFFFAYLVLLLGCSTIVSLDDLPFAESFSAALTMISNVGPGLGAVGPTCNFGFLSPISKLALSFTMLLGRLEILPLLVLFLPSVWRKR